MTGRIAELAAALPAQPRRPRTPAGAGHHRGRHRPPRLPVPPVPGHGAAAPGRRRRRDHRPPHRAGARPSPPGRSPSPCPVPDGKDPSSPSSRSRRARSGRCSPATTLRQTPASPPTHAQTAPPPKPPGHRPTRFPRRTPRLPRRTRPKPAVRSSSRCHPCSPTGPPKTAPTRPRPPPRRTTPPRPARNPATGSCRPPRRASSPRERKRAAPPSPAPKRPRSMPRPKPPRLTQVHHRTPYHPPRRTPCHPTCQAPLLPPPPTVETAPQARDEAAAAPPAAPSASAPAGQASAGTGAPRPAAQTGDGTDLLGELDRVLDAIIERRRGTSGQGDAPRDDFADIRTAFTFLRNALDIDGPAPRGDDGLRPYPACRRPRPPRPAPPPAQLPAQPPEPASSTTSGQPSPTCAASSTCPPAGRHARGSAPPPDLSASRLLDRAAEEAQACARWYPGHARMAAHLDDRPGRAGTGHRDPGRRERLLGGNPPGHPRPRLRPHARRPGQPGRLRDCPPARRAAGARRAGRHPDVAGGVGAAPSHCHLR